MRPRSSVPKRARAVSSHHSAHGSAPAFSYFLIGVMPIPLTLAMLSAGAYLLADRIISARLRREVTAVVELAALQNRVPENPRPRRRRDLFRRHASSFDGMAVTDGLVEAADSSGEPFGFERFEALLKAYAASDAEELRDVLLEALAHHTGATHPEDDRTLVILTLL
jgi:hypothetical protein